MQHLKEKIKMINEYRILYYKIIGNICLYLSKIIGKVSNKLYNKYVKNSFIIDKSYERKIL